MNIVGISAFYHDSAACLVQDGEVVAAAQEERFTRKKHDASFPRHALEFCLRQGKIGAKQVDYVAFYDKPLRKFDRLVSTYLSFAPTGFAQFAQGLPVWLREKLFLPRELREGFGGEYTGRYIFPEHHESHAASAFFPSPYDHAAILTMDGVGEWSTSTLGVGRGNHLELTHEIRFPHSIGLLYSAFTYFTGFKVNSGEYKLMGLAPYGEPRYAQTIFDKLIDLKPDGSFRLDLAYFNYCQGLTMTSPAFDRLFDGPPRKPEAPLTKREMDLGASIQAVTEEIVLRSARHLAKSTGAPHLVMAGGVALNCVANGKILRDGCFRDVWVQPAAGDAGGALGAALIVWHQLLDKPRASDDRNDKQSGSLLGPSFSDDEIQSFLDRVGARYRRYDEHELLDGVVELLTSEQVVGWFQDRCEFGPRALGARSILGDARSKNMQSVMNLKIKFRESFRPFAPSVLREHAHEWFDVRDGQQSPYMLMVAPIATTRRVAVSDRGTGLDLLKTPRSEIPAVTHVDYSARIHTVDERNGRYRRLLQRFEAKTGCPVLINTSFNIRGEPIVGTPENAYRCFMACDMDALVLERFVLLKKDQPQKTTTADVQAYKAQFALD